MNTVIWQCEAFNKSMRDAIRSFADTYWDKPRNVASFSVIDGLTGEFRMRDGVANYAVNLNACARPAVWVVARME